MLITQLTDTKGLECAHDGEIILQQKPKNANNSLVLQSMFMILARLPFLMLCIGLFYPNWTVLGFFLHYRVHLFKFSFRVTDFIHIFFLTLELNPVCKSCMYVFSPFLFLQFTLWDFYYPYSYLDVYHMLCSQAPHKEFEPKLKICYL